MMMMMMVMIMMTMSDGPNTTQHRQAGSDLTFVLEMTTLSTGPPGGGQLCDDSIVI